MKLHIYAKLNENLSAFDDVVNILKTDNVELFITNESRRSFKEFENIKESGNDVIYIISSLNSLGLNDADIANQLSWFIENSVKLVICEINSTYEYGVSQPLNQAILSTLLQSILSGNKNIITVSFKKSNSGRSKLPFPETWDDLYEKWSNNEISSKEFIDATGLKKATFYNLLTEYREIQSLNAQYLKRYNVV